MTHSRQTLREHPINDSADNENIAGRKARAFTRRFPFGIETVKLWICLSTFASLAGWLLSALGMLNRAGYIVCSAIVLVFVMFHRPTRSWLAQFGQVNWQKLNRRFHRPLPAAFAFLALLVFIGGVLYPPTNHTALTYRFPRVLQWLAHEHWFWIHTENYRMNNRACGIEWLTAPLLLFTKSDRGLFLLNFIPFLLLPGLIFSVCQRLGVRSRVAWPWMWILPTGYSFLLQAGSAGNDTFPTVYALAMIDFGCRAWTSRKISDLWFSILAAALLVGAKASNLPLGLPWIILIFPLLRLLKAKPLATALVLFVAIVVSFVPTAILNMIYCHGDWSGLNLERAGMDMKNPLVGVWGNTLLLLLNNFVPPMFPIAHWWNEHILSLLPHFIVAPLNANFEQGYHWLGELPTEDWSGLGFGVSVLLAASVLASFVRSSAFRRSKSPEPPEGGTPNLIPSLIRRAVLIAPWIALLAYCMKSGMVTAARLISPYYPLLLPSLLIAAGQAQVIRHRWWRALVWLNFLLALVVLILTPARPLWPAKTILARAVALKPNQPLLLRAQKVYSVYADRSDPLAPVRAMLPPAIKVVGFVGNPDDMDISLWRPYGSRRVEHILTNDSLEEIRQRGIQYAVVDELELQERRVPLTNWLQQVNAEVLTTTNITIKISTGSQTWHVVQFK